MEMDRRTFCTAVTGAGAATLLTTSVAGAQSEQFEPVWEATSDITGFQADEDAVYLVTEDSIRAQDPTTGDARRIVASPSGINTFAYGDGFADGDSVYPVTDTGIERHTKQGEREWSRPISGIKDARIGDDGIYVTTAGPDNAGTEGGTLIRLRPDGGVAWRKDLNWGFVSDLTVTDDYAVVGGFEDNDLASNPLRIRAFDKRTGEAQGQVTTQNRDQYATRFVEVKLQHAEDDTVYALADHGGDYIQMLRVEASEPTAVWKSGTFTEFPRTYNAYLPSPEIIGDGVYGLDENGHLAKYSTVSGEYQWSAGSLVPEGVAPYGDGIIAVGMDDSTTQDEEASGTILLASYSSSGLENWRREIGSGPKEGHSFSGPYKLPAVDDGYLIAEWGNNLRLFTPPSVRRDLQPTPTATPTDSASTDGESNTVEPTDSDPDEDEPDGTTTTDEPAGDSGDDTSPPDDESTQRDLLVPGDGLATTLDTESVPLLSVGGFVLSIAGFAYQLFKDD